MSLPRTMRAVAVLSALTSVPSHAFAQRAGNELLVTRVLPDRNVTARSIVTVSFDRPVIALSGDSAGTSTIARFRMTATPGGGALRHPAVRVQWRDPVTLRVLPLEPLVPGATYSVTVDTPLVASDGARLRRPHTATISVAPTQVSLVIPTFAAREVVTLSPTGRIAVVMNGVVDTTAWRDRVSLTIENAWECAPKRIPYRLVSQRVPQGPGDLGYRNVDVFTRGGRNDTLSRVLEYLPSERVPDGCMGTVSVPSAVPGDTAASFYRVHTAPRFELQAQAPCAPKACADTGVVMFSFTAAATREEVLEHVRIEPASTFAKQVLHGGPTVWRIEGVAARPGSGRIVIDSAFVDTFGRAYVGPRVIDFEVPNRRPAAALAEQQIAILPRSAQARLRLHHVNADSVVIEAIKLTPQREWEHFAYPGRATPLRVPTRVDTVRHVVAVTSPLNAEVVSLVPLPPRLASSASGWFVRVRVHTPRPGAEYPAATAQLERSLSVNALQLQPLLVRTSNLAVHTRLSGSPSAVMVTDVGTGAPVRDAHVRLIDSAGHDVANARTDAFGVATMTLHNPDSAPHAQERWVKENARIRFVMASSGNDTLMLPTRVTPTDGMPDPYSAGAALPPGARQMGAAFRRSLMYADRAIYRPGEQLYVGVIVREQTAEGLRPPHGDSLRWRLEEYGYRPEPLVERTVALSATGSVADSVRLPSDAAPDDYQVVASLYRDGRWHDIASTQLRIAEYRAPEFLVSVSPDSTRKRFSDTAAFSVRARYVFAAPVVGSPVTWSATFVDDHTTSALPLLPKGFSVGRWQPYEFGLYPSAFPQARLSGVGVIDSAGVLRALAVIPRDVFTRPVRANLTAGVTDISRQVVSATGATTAHPSSFYLAIKPAARAGVLGDTLTLSYMALSPTGTVVGNVPVRVALVRWRKSNTQASRYGEAVPIDTTWHSVAQTGDSVRTLRVPLDSTGLHELVLHAVDESGRLVLSSTAVSVTQGAVKPPPGTTPVTRVTMRLLDTMSRVGDSAVVEFDSPFSDAEAWITVEREGILWQMRRRVRRGTSRVVVPIAARFVPNVYVGVMLIARGNALDAPSVATRVQHGFVQLPVSAEPSRLQLAIEPASRVMSPGDTARVSVRVRNARDEAAHARVTIWAVDESVLSLAAYSAPDPFTALFSPSRYGMSVRSSLAFLQTLGRESALLRRIRSPWFMPANLGDLGVAGGIAMRSASLSMVTVSDVVDVSMRANFRSTAFFAADVPTDADGVAHVAARLPDNVTTYRVFAIAYDSTDRVGRAEDSLRTFLPLVYRAALPRFLRGGDSLYAGGVVSVADATARDVTVSASARGTLETGVRDSVVRATSTPVEIRFAWRVPESPTSDSVQFEGRAIGIDASDGVRSTLPIRAGGRPRTFATSDVVRGESALSIAVPVGTDLERSRVVLRIGAPHLAFLKDAGDYALAYPFTCTEQLSSNLRVLLAVLSAQRAGATMALDSSQVKNEASRLVKLIESRAQDDGSINYWGSGSWTTPWVSSYAGLALLDAKNAGFKTNGEVQGGLLDHLKNVKPDTMWRGYGSRSERRELESYRLGQQLARAWYIRSIGDSSPALENELRANANALSWEDRAWLAELLHVMGDQPLARTLLDALWRDVKPAGALVDLPAPSWASLMPSSLRGPARLIAATRRIHPEQPLLGALEQRVLLRGQRALSPWWNTQDLGWLAPVVAATSSTSLVAPTRIVAIGGDGSRVALSAEPSRVSDTTVAAMPYVVSRGDSIRVSVRVQSESPSFVTMEFIEVAKTRPVTPDARGLAVERWYERVSDGRAITELTEGELVRVHLRIRAPAERDFVALEDLLPAGLEVVDPQLRINAGVDARANARGRVDEDDDEEASSRWWSPWQHRELRDDRVQFFARYLWAGVHDASYLARATTSGRFVRPPAQAEEMYNAGVQGRSDGGWFGVLRCVGTCR